MSEYGPFSQDKWDKIIEGKKAEIKESKPLGEPIELSEEEYNLISRTFEFTEKGFPKNPEAAALLKRKGIQVNSGLINVNLKGKSIKVNTDIEDFGTTIV